MTVFDPDGATVFRDYVTDGVPLSGAHDPVKADIRDWAAQVEDSITSVEDAVEAIDAIARGYVGGFGKTTVNFGAFPGNDDAGTQIFGQDGLTTASSVRAWLEATATVDHSVDEHRVDPPIITVGDIAAGTFVIYAQGRSDIPGDLPYGLWTVAWSWNN